MRGRRDLEMRARLFPRAERVTDKRPDNFLYIGLIKSLFPDAKIVHTVRDPLDTCLSNYFLHLDHCMSTRSTSWISRTTTRSTAA